MFVRVPLIDELAVRIVVADRVSDPAAEDPGEHAAADDQHGRRARQRP